MAMDMKRYPSDWKDISKRIRFERAGNKCEWCGIPNHILAIRKRGTPDYLIETIDSDCVYTWPDGRWIKLSELPDGYDYDHPTRIVLTVAHLGTDHPDGRKGDKHDKMDVREENLAALCQACHLNFDRDEHKENSKKTRLRKKLIKIAATGQKSLFEAVQG